MKKYIISIALFIVFISGVAYAKAKFEYILFKEGTTAILTGGAVKDDITRFTDGIVTCYIVPTKVQNNIVNQSISCVK